MAREGAAVIRARSLVRASFAVACGIILAAHIGSPDVFFSGAAGPYALRVVIRPPEVVPGVARVLVHAPAGVRRVSIRPVFWRAGSRGAPSADEMRRIDSASGSPTFEGSLWLMARGAYSVEVSAEGAAGPGKVMVPVASVATGRLALDPALGALLVVLGVVLVAGLVNIVYKGAGESLVEPGAALDANRKRRARRVAAIAVPIISVALLGGARWWGAVDRDYERTIYRPSPLDVVARGDTLRIRASDTIWQGLRPSGYLPDHGKYMHMFLVSGDGRAFAHLHPHPLDSSTVPAFETRVPPLPAGSYRIFADVVHETGFERTLVGNLTVEQSRALLPPYDADDAWFTGDASRDGIARLADGSSMRLTVSPPGVIVAGEETTLHVDVSDARGRAVTVEPYLGMVAHAVVLRTDGDVYVHLHPMGTVSTAARDAFLARDRGDTTSEGRPRVIAASMSVCHMNCDSASGTDFPYAFPRAGSYRLFVQVKRAGRILTGAYALTVAESVGKR